MEKHGDFGGVRAVRAEGLVDSWFNNTVIYIIIKLFLIVNSNLVIGLNQSLKPIIHFHIDSKAFKMSGTIFIL